MKYHIGIWSEAKNGDLGFRSWYYGIDGNDDNVIGIQYHYGEWRLCLFGEYFKFSSITDLINIQSVDEGKKVATALLPKLKKLMVFA